MDNENNIIDLRNLLNLLENKKSLFIAKNHCIFDATFGEASKLIHGADVDLIIDNRIIDIKTIIKSDFTRDIFNQIFGYYILSTIDKIDVLDKKLQIDTIGIYYSRYGELIEIPVKSIVDKDKLNNFIKLFEKELKAVNNKTITHRPSSNSHYLLWGIACLFGLVYQSHFSTFD